MARRDNDVLLQDQIHHTNRTVPWSDYIKYKKYPEQDSQFVGKTISIRLRHLDEAENKDVDPPVSNIVVAKCKVLRCDKTEPFTMIAVTEDYKYILVGKVEHFLNKSIVFKYPDQLTNYIGLWYSDQYFAEIDEREGAIIRCDNGEPCYTVLMERYLDGTVRFVLGDEVQARVSKDVVKEIVRTEADIVKIRENLLKGAKPYGSVD